VDDPHDEYESDLVLWLHELPRAMYQRIEPQMLELVDRVGKDTMRFAFDLASVFGAFGNHVAEKSALERALAVLPAERHSSEFASKLSKLSQGARLNCDRAARCRDSG
jgi:hypothetical protein